MKLIIYSLFVVSISFTYSQSHTQITEDSNLIFTSLEFDDPLFHQYDSLPYEKHDSLFFDIRELLYRKDELTGDTLIFNDRLGDLFSYDSTILLLRKDKILIQEYSLLPPKSQLVKLTLYELTLFNNQYLLDGIASTYNDKNRLIYSKTYEMGEFVERRTYYRSGEVKVKKSWDYKEEEFRETKLKKNGKVKKGGFSTNQWLAIVIPLFVLLSM